MLGGPHLQDIRNFQAAEQSLLPVRTTAWGPFIFVHLHSSRYVTYCFAALCCSCKQESSELDMAEQPVDAHILQGLAS